MGAQSGLVEVLDAEREMIEIAPFGAGRGAAFRAERAVKRDKIDEGRSGAQMIEPERLLLMIERAAEHVAVERDHPLDIARAGRCVRCA